MIWHFFEFLYCMHLRVGYVVETEVGCTAQGFCTRYFKESKLNVHCRSALLCMFRTAKFV